MATRSGDDEDSPKVPQVLSGGGLIRQEGEMLTVRGSATRRDVKNARLASDEARHIARVAHEKERAAAALLGVMRHTAGILTIRTEMQLYLQEAKVRQTKLRGDMRQTELENEIREETAPVTVATARRYAEAKLVDAETAVEEAKQRHIRAAMQTATLQVEQQNAPAVVQQQAQAKQLEEWAVLIVNDAAQGHVPVDDQHLYHSYAAFHYVAARLSGETHEQAFVETVKTVLRCYAIMPLSLAEAHENKRRYESRKGVWTAQRASAAAYKQQREEQEAMLERERLKVQAAAEARRQAEVEKDMFFGGGDYDPAD